MVSTPRRWLRLTRERLENTGLESAVFESKILLETVLELPHGAPLPETALTAEQAEKLETLTARRIRREPLQYLCGSWEFFGLEFSVGEGVLIPRQDTETLVETVLRLRQGQPSTKLLDLCSGTGCIAVAIAAHLPQVSGAALELSEAALLYLRTNLERHGCPIRPIQGNALELPQELQGARFDVITCNPPYLTSDDMAALQPEVSHEPKTALYGGTDGLDFYRRLTPLWKERLQEGGVLVYEVGAGQAQDVAEIFRRCDYPKTEIVRDLAGTERVVVGYIERSETVKFF